MKELTARQKRVLDYLTARAAEGVSPTVREIGAALGIASTSTVSRDLRALQERGCLTKTGRVSRGISLPLPAVALVPVYAYYNPETGVGSGLTGDRVPFPAPREARPEYFALRLPAPVREIPDAQAGDVLVFEKLYRARHGQVVAASVGGVLVAGVMQRQARGAWVLSDGWRHSLAGEEDVALVGVRVGLLRQYPAD